MYKKLFSVTEGQHKIISDYYNRNDFLKFARQALYETISKIAGESVTEKVKVYGLDKIHLYLTSFDSRSHGNLDRSMRSHALHFLHEQLTSL